MNFNNLFVASFLFFQVHENETIASVRRRIAQRLDVQPASVSFMFRIFSEILFIFEIFPLRNF